MTEFQDPKYKSSSTREFVDAIKESFMHGFKGDDITEGVYADDVPEDAGIAFVCVIAFWLLFSDNHVPEFIPSSILGLSLSRYFVRKLLPSESNEKSIASTVTSVEEAAPGKEETFVFISYSR